MHGASRHALSSASDDEVGGSKRAMREQLQNKLRASGNRAPPHGGGASRHALSSARDDDGGGLTARLREQLQ
jgi:hypothetical protein